MKDSNLQKVPESAIWLCRSKFDRFWLTLLLLLLVGVTGAQNIPVEERIKSGEEVRYELYFKWGLLMPRAGQASLSIKEVEYENEPAYHYCLLFNTTGLFEKVYRMRDTLDCYFTPDMLLLRSEKRVNENDYYLIDDIKFSYDEENIVAHSHRYTPTRTKIDTTLVSSAQYMFDMLGATLYLRSLDWDEMNYGDEFPFQVAIGRDRINVSFRYTGQQIVERSETLKYRTRHFYIDIFDDAFTQSKEAAEIWIGDDENHIPVKIRAKLKIGAVEVYYKSSKGLRYPLSSRFVIPRP
ncbi:DUF3108 domain-containing protein [Parabacteroides sp. AM08-6]|uniref:DUF3108 domain-containing protein n=1 Tax=Parabacteroides sp. AM08-6 TaxID=2292053 RepID=UPI000EFF3A04|nr:DUF3108 domain-containing protein [Parabacteroides sp. AM08-6]RHJ84869.1 DUF3108 domain-containing protein [Parabacteroides sp. AM08-6]